MSDKLKIALGGIVIVLLFVLANSLYVVNQTEQAIVLQFGEPIRVVKEPGLKAKIPFIQNVVFYDTRLLNLDPPAQEVVLNDKKRLDVDSFTRYRIVDPLRFYKTVRTEVQARSKLEEIVNSSVRKILGRITLQELLSQQRTKIMADSAVKVDAEQIGVSVADVRIRRADLPLEVLQAINARMKAERERDAKEFRATGQQEAQKIRATAEKEKKVIIAEAEKKAQIIRGQGDQEAIAIWNNAAGVDPKFYAFYRSLEAYKNSMTDKDSTSMVLAPDSEFFEFFRKTGK